MITQRNCSNKSHIITSFDQRSLIGELTFKYTVIHTFSQIGLKMSDVTLLSSYQIMSECSCILM